MVRDLAVRIAEVNAVGGESAAQRAAGVTGGWRHEYPLEARFSEDPRVGDAIQRHATAHAEIGQTRFLTKRTGDVHQRVFKYALHAGGAVRKPPPLCALQIDRLIRAAWRAEQIDKPR